MAHKANLRICLAISIFLLVMAGLAQADTITVGPEAAYDFDTIQAGIDAAVDGDTVLVAPGEYVITEPVTFRGKAITVKSEAGRDETTIRMGTPSDSNRGSVVIFENNETAASVLDGFTITDGIGLRLWAIRESEFAWVGGGICFVDASSGTVRNCAIVRNTAKHHGGGVFCAYQCSPVLMECIIADSAAATGAGGGLCCTEDSSITMNNCIIRDNTAASGGGGIYCGHNSSATMTDCIVRDNSTPGEAGGGVCCHDSSSLTMRNCAVIGNTVQNDSGGVYVGVGQCSGTLINCVIARNTAHLWGGGGVMCSWPGSSLTIRNCTIWGNSGGSRWGGGGVLCRQASMTVTNSIIWANTAPIGTEISVEDPTSTLTIAYSNVGGGQSKINVEGGCTLDWGEGNIDADPLFASLHYRDKNGTRDPSDDFWVDGDYHLKSEAGRWNPNSQTWVLDEMTSPCIDAGDPNSDWTAELWPHGERINMGAYGGTREASMSVEPQALSLPRVAYIFSSNSEAAQSFRSFLVSYGCSTSLINVDEVPSAELDSYDLIIVANDTGYWSTWIDAESVVTINDSGKPILGLGEGGYDFFGVLGLSIGRPHGMHGDNNSIYVIDPNHSLFSTPYAIDVPEDRILQLYTETNHVTLYLWPVPENVKVLAGEVDQNGYYPLAFEPDRHVFWSFTESPEYMNEIGKDLFINIVIWTANTGWEMEI